MNVMDWPTPYQTNPGHDRPILGGVLHSTETYAAVACHAGGSWTYQIDRVGTIFAHVPEGFCAWGARAADRWRPAWMVTSPIGVSDPNYCAVHIELVSDASHREAGPAYTEEQYDSLIWLVADIEGRNGAIWWVGHGQIQSDRSDPVNLDWERAGFGPFDGVNGRAFVAREQEDDEMTETQQRILDACARHGLFSDGDVDWLAGTWNDLAAQVDSLGTLLGTAQDERDTAAQEAAALQAEVETLEVRLAEPPPTTPAPRVSGVTVEFSDGTLFAARDL